MGGKAQNVERISKADYKHIYNEVRITLNNNKINHFVPVVPCDKETFGDLDVFIELNPFNKHTVNAKREQLKNIFIDCNPQNVKNGMNILYDNFQIDFNFVSLEKYNSSYFFYSLSPLSNLIGRMIRPLNLKYNNKGLYFVYNRSDGNYKKDIFITNDTHDIFDFLGMSTEIFQNENLTYEALYESVIESRFFNLDKFMALRYIDSSRSDEQIEDFLDYICSIHWATNDEVYDKNKFDLTNYRKDKSRLSIKMSAVLTDDFFNTNVYETVKNEIAKEEEANRLHKILNGNLVMEWTGLSGKELGNFIGAFKASHNVHNIDTIETMKGKVEDFFSTYKPIYNE